MALDLDLNALPPEYHDQEGPSANASSQDVQVGQLGVSVPPTPINVETYDDDVIISSRRAFEEARNNSRRNRGRTVVVDVDSGRTFGPSPNNRNNRRRLSSNPMIIDCDLYIDLEGSSDSMKDNVQSVASTPPPPPPPKEPTFNCPVCIGPLVEEMSTNQLNLSNVPHVPKFGNWESGEIIPYTVYFDKCGRIEMRYGGRGSNSGHPMRQSAGSEHSIERSPLHPHYQAKVTGKGGGSPSWEGTQSYESSYGTPGRSQLKPVTRGDESPVKGAAVSKFGEWDENKPASAEGYTHIFNQVRVKRHARLQRVVRHLTPMYHVRKHNANANDNPKKMMNLTLGFYLSYMGL
ncbi:hypothetical protein F0562_021001 [Nyssa sinensis]|uniref:RIN4 pathogenic type III effector avirulence factor Avr cleavage site domain-containing protein n=1 Tax=Nyssa sinensis TaxID=561372 RepID=A0A5J5BL72_9ASTE|nr:hypothetical protein F0562_021001 [Nyssa sinensis]